MKRIPMSTRILRRSVSRLAAAVGVVAIVAAVACSGATEIHGGQSCTDPIRLIISPADTAILINSVFQPRSQLVNCSGVAFTEEPRWVAVDTSIVSVNAVGGLIGGKALGETEVHVISDRYGMLGKLTVRVELPKN